METEVNAFIMKGIRSSEGARLPSSPIPVEFLNSKGIFKAHISVRLEIMMWVEFPTKDGITQNKYGTYCCGDINEE